MYLPRRKDFFFKKKKSWSDFDSEKEVMVWEDDICLIGIWLSIDILTEEINLLVTGIEDQKTNVEKRNIDINRSTFIPNLNLWVFSRVDRWNYFDR